MACSFLRVGKLVRHSKNLPIIARVTEGFCGLDDKDDYSFAADDEYRLTHLNKQPRVIVKDKIGRHVSLPINRPLRFRKFKDDNTMGPPSLLSRLVETLDEGDHLIADKNEEVDFWLSGDTRRGTKLGVLEFVAEYQERFLVGNTILEGKLISEPVVIPAYVSIKIVLAEGLNGQPAEEFDILRGQFTKQSQNFKNYQANGNLEIMLFEGKVTDYKDYDYITPSNFLRVDAKAVLGDPKVMNIPQESMKVYTLERKVKEPEKSETGYLTSRTATHNPAPLDREFDMKPVQTEEPKFPIERGPLPPLPPKRERTIKPTNKTAPPIPRRIPLKQNLHTISSQNTRRVADYQNKVLVVNPSNFTQQVDAEESDLYEVTEPDHPEFQEDMVEDDSGLYEEVHLDDVEQEEDAVISTTKKGNKVNYGRLNSEPTPESGSKNIANHSIPARSQSESQSTDDVMRDKEQQQHLLLNPSEDDDTQVTQYSTSNMSHQQQDKLNERLAVVKEMSIEEVCELLDSLNLSKFKDSFRENGIDGDLLSELTVSDLQQGLKFNIIQAKKLFKNITENWRPK